MKKNHGLVISFLFWIFMVSVAFWFYNDLPPIIDTHWNALGEVDGSMDKLHGLLVIPVVSLFVILVQFIVPFSLKNREKARNAEFVVNLLFILFIAMLSGIYFYMIAWNFGHTYDFSKVIPIFFATLFYLVGVLITRMEPKISKERLGKLHPRDILNMQKINGNSFKIAAIIMLLSLLFNPYTFYFVLLGGVGAAAVSMVNTLRTYRKIGK